MSALDSKMVMEQLIASLPPYAECGVNHTDAYKETCKRYYPTTSIFTTTTTQQSNRELKTKHHHLVVYIYILHVK